MQKQIEISAGETRQDWRDAALKAGPFEDCSRRNVRGTFILKTSSLEEARAWVATDPAVKAGRFAPEFLKWYVDKGSLK